MSVVVTMHAWRRYEERMRAYVPSDELQAFAEAAIEVGEPIPIKAAEDIFCRIYRRFALIFRSIDGDDAALITMLPRGERPNSERTVRIPEA